MTKLLISVLLGIVTSGAFPEQAPSSLSGRSENARVLLKEGTEVRLRFGESVSSKTALVGDSVPFFLDEEIKVGAVTVARSGAVAVGTVSHCKKAEMLGQGGELSVLMEYIRVGDKKVRIIGAHGSSGEDKVRTSVVLTILFGPVGLIKHGKDVEVRKGTPFVAYVRDSVAVSLNP